MNTTRRTKTTVASIVAAAALAGTIGLVAVGGADAAPTKASVSTAAKVKAPKPVATVPAVSGGSTSVALDTGFTDALTSLKLTPGVLGSATLADGAVSFPVTGGSVTYYDPASGYRPYVQGVLLHDGSGLSLTSGATTVDLTNFTISPGKPARLFGDVSVNGKLAASSAPLFDLDGTTLKPLTTDSTAGTATLAGTKVLLSPEAAGLLNSTFSTDALKGGFLVGVSTIVIKTS